MTFYNLHLCIVGFYKFFTPCCKYFFLCRKTNPNCSNITVNDAENFIISDIHKNNS